MASSTAEKMRRIYPDKIKYGNAHKSKVIRSLFDVPPSLKKRILARDERVGSSGSAVPSPMRHSPHRGTALASDQAQNALMTSTGSNFFPNALNTYAVELQAQTTDSNHVKSHRNKLQQALA
jgi:hypothetical protein